MELSFFKKRIIILIILMITLIFVWSHSLAKEKKIMESGWSSIDNVFAHMEDNLLIKEYNIGPIKIGFSEEKVKKVMGIPDQIDKENKIYYYHHSPIYFNQNWKVQSWDNRYGNLKVINEKDDIIPGSSILKVFELMGFPIHIQKINHSYKMEYAKEIVFVGKHWQVESIQEKEKMMHQVDREGMTLNDIFQEYQYYLANIVN